MFTVQASGLSGGGNYVIEAGPNTAVGSADDGELRSRGAIRYDGRTGFGPRHRHLGLAGIRRSRSTCTWA